MRLSVKIFLRMVRASALYDLLITAAFSIPITVPIALRHISKTNQALGGHALPEFDSIHTLFVGMMGCLVVVWSMLRLNSPSVRLGRYDGAARMLFSLWMGWVLFLTREPVLWFFLIPEILLGMIQFSPILPIKKTDLLPKIIDPKEFLARARSAGM